MSATGRRVLNLLFPDKRRYLRSLHELAAACPRAASLLERGFGHPDRFPELAHAIRAIGTEAGATTAALHTSIEQAFTLPINREDIHHLAARLKRIVDIAGGTAGRGSTLPLGGAKEAACRLSAVLVSATREVQEAVAALDDPKGAFRHCRAIKASEEAGTAIWEEGLSALFAVSPNPIEVLVWKEMYDLLEKGLDACDDVANVVESISVRRT